MAKKKKKKKALKAEKKLKKEKLPVLNAGHFLELMDRSDGVAQLIEDRLIEHPICAHHLEIKDQLSLAQSIILDVYGRIAAVEDQWLKDNPEKGKLFFGD